MKTRTEKKKLIAMSVLMAIAIPLAVYNVRTMLWPGDENSVTMATKIGAAQPASPNRVNGFVPGS